MVLTTLNDYCYIIYKVIFNYFFADCFNEFSMSDLSNIAQIVISIINLILVFYVFVYQRRKDNDQDQKNIRSENQSINLQWFKDLAIQPNLNNINYFYDFLSSTQLKFTKENNQIINKLLIVAELKDEYYKIRLSFVDILESIDISLHSSVSTNFETLIDKLSTVIIDSDADFTESSVFKEHILTPISLSRKQFISDIFRYKGTIN